MFVSPRRRTRNDCDNAVLQSRNKMNEKKKKLTKINQFCLFLSIVLGNERKMMTHHATN